MSRYPGMNFTLTGFSDILDFMNFTRNSLERALQGTGIGRTAFLIVSILAVFFCTFTAIASAAGPNLVENPSLEDANGGSPSNWFSTYWGNVTPTFAYPVAGKSGDGASVTLGSNTSGDVRWQHDAVAVEAGASYEYSSWYKSNAETEVDIAFTHADGSISWGWVATLPSSGNSWKEVTATISVPQGVTKMSVFHLIFKEGTLVIDDTSLSKAGDTSPDPDPEPEPDPTPDPTPDPDPEPSDTFSQGMITLSFDDSWSSQFDNAKPILDDAGIAGTFYLTSEPIQEGWDDFMTAEEAKDLYEDGHEIGGHTITHRDLTTLSVKKIKQEITKPEAYLENITGGDVTTIAYPYGAYNSKVTKAINQIGAAHRPVTGRLAGDSHDLNMPSTNPYTLDSFSPIITTKFSEIKSAIDAAIEEKGWYILSYHEIINSGVEYSTTPAQLQEVVDYIKESGIKVVTMEEGGALLGQ